MASETMVEGRPRMAAVGWISGGALMLVWAVMLVGNLADRSAWLVAVAPVFLLIYLAIELRWAERVVFVHLGLGGLLALTATALLPAPGAALWEALERAGMVAALFVALGLLRQAAGGSAMVRSCGQMLVAQPGGRRYAAMTVGGHIFGLILNFGVVNLLGPMIRPPGSPPVTIDQQRLFLAVLRGFTTVIYWSPLTLAFAVIGSSHKDVDWPEVLAIGFVLNLAVLLLGWGLDRFGARRRSTGPTGPLPTAPADGPRAAWGVIGLVGLMIAAAVAIEEALDVRMIIGVIAAVPLIATLWMARQGDPGRRLAAAWGALSDYTARGLPAERRAVAVLCNAAFAGTVIGALVPAGSVEAGIAAIGLPPILIAPMITGLIVGIAPIGVNPLLAVSLLVGVLPPPEAVGIDMTLMALALLLGWGTSVGATNATAAALSTATLAGVPPDRVVRAWNAGFTICALVFLSLVLMGLHLVLG